LCNSHIVPNFPLSQAKSELIIYLSRMNVYGEPSEEDEQFELNRVLLIVKRRGNDCIHELSKFSGEGYMHTHSTNASVFRMLLQRGGDINQRDSRDRTPLISVVRSPRGNLRATKFLLDNNADVRIKDASGLTVWDYAVMKQSSRPILLLLLGQGAVSLKEFRKVPKSLRMHIILMILCIPLEISRLQQFWLSKDCISRLREYLILI